MINASLIDRFEVLLNSDNQQEQGARRNTKHKQIQNPKEPKKGVAKSAHKKK